MVKAKAKKARQAEFLRQALGSLKEA